MHSSALVLSFFLSFFLSQCGGGGDCADGVVQSVSVAVLLLLMPLGVAWLLSFAFGLFITCSLNLFILFYFLDTYAHIYLSTHYREALCTLVADQERLTAAHSAAILQ